MTNRTRLFGLPRISPGPSHELANVAAPPDENLGFPASPAELVGVPEETGELASSPSSLRRHRITGPEQPGSPRPVRHLRWLALGMAVVAGAAIAIVAVTGQPAHRSGLPWASGVYPVDGTPAGAAAFAAWRGRQLDVVDAWSARATWTQIDDPTWLYQRWKGEPYTMAFGVPMLPEDVPGVSLQACADGAYDAYWHEFGTVISSYGLGHSIIRLGWEFNGNWYVWQATDPTTWARCWQQIVTSVRSTAPDLQWDWDVNRGISAGLADPALAYPGNAYVSMIGIDSYDEWPSATTATGWETQLNGPQGLNYWLRFAKAHGKLLSVPEWGSVATGTQSGGDDAQYVNDMRAFFALNASAIAFECNFQGPSSSTGGTYGAGTSIPKASAAYKADF
jgi:Glycosyl hydrolase family 26